MCWWMTSLFFFIFTYQSAASCYIELIVKESDNNVKLIVLDRLIALKDNPSHEKVLRVSFWVSFLLHVWGAAEYITTL